MAVIDDAAVEPTIEHAHVLVTWGLDEDDLIRHVAQLPLAGAGVRSEVLSSPGSPIHLRLAGPDPERITWAQGVVKAGLGDAVLGDEGATLEGAVIELLQRQGLSMGTAESLTSGVLAARLSEPPGASDVFRGGLVAYASQVKYDVLDVREGPVVEADAAAEMAAGAARLLEVDVAVALTGVAGPAPMEGKPPGTVHVASWVEGEVRTVALDLDGDRERIRQESASHALDLVRHQLLARERRLGLRH